LIIQQLHQIYTALLVLDFCGGFVVGNLLIRTLSGR